jgi:hypothetical protein
VRLFDVAGDEHIVSAVRIDDSAAGDSESESEEEGEA